MLKYSLYRVFHESDFDVIKFDYNEHIVLSDAVLKIFNCKYQIKYKQISFNIYTMFMVVT